MRTDWSLAGTFLSRHPRDAARLLAQQAGGTTAALLAGFPPRTVADNLAQMEPAEAVAILTRLPTELAPAVVCELSLEAAASVLGQLDPPEREPWLAGLTPEARRSIAAALDHPTGTAGALMDSKVLALPPELTAREARRRLSRRSSQTGNYLYLVDAGHKPVGVISLRELVLAPSGASLGSLMYVSVACIPASTETDTILAHPGWRELHALPVVDSRGALVGVLRRETYERLRQERVEQSTTGNEGLGVALAELFWTVTASVIDELGRPAPPGAKP